MSYRGLGPTLLLALGVLAACGGDGDGASGGACKADADCAAQLPDTNPPNCAQVRCDAGKCAIRAKDSDGDGQSAKNCVSLRAGVTIELGKDCDDTNTKIFEGAWDGPKVDGKPDACDGVDNDCNGKSDDAKGKDGSSCSCTPGAVTPCATLENGMPIEYPGGKPQGACKLGSQTCSADGKLGQCVGAKGPEPELCDGLDNDCDGKVDNGATNPPTWYYDGDGDGHASQAVAARESCDNPGKAKINCPDGSLSCEAKWSKSPKSIFDCNDKDPAIYPGAWDGPAAAEVPYGIAEPGLQASYYALDVKFPATDAPDCDASATTLSAGACFAGTTCNLVNNQGCPSSQRCVRYTDGTTGCIANTGNAATCAACSKQTDCAAGNVCISGKCTRFCCTDGDCGKGGYCATFNDAGGAGECLADTTGVKAKRYATRTELSVNFDMFQATRGPGLPGDLYGNWVGNIFSPQTGDYTFTVKANGAVNLYVGGTKIIDGWTDKQQALSAKTPMKKDTPTSLWVNWYDAAGPGALTLTWQGPGVPEQVLTVRQRPVGGAKPDRCDNVDNDCSGTADDQRVRTAGSTSALDLGCKFECDPLNTSPAKPLSEECGISANQGICHKGSRHCGNDGKWTACDGEAKADKAQCNGLDNDCSGKVDSQEITCQCTSGSKVDCNVNACNPSKVDCVGGSFSCPPPNPKLSGSCDNGRTGACKRVGSYQCESGVSKCSVASVDPAASGDFVLAADATSGSWDVSCDGCVEYGIKTDPNAKPQPIRYHPPTPDECATIAMLGTILAAPLVFGAWCSDYHSEADCTSKPIAYSCPKLPASTSSAQCFSPDGCGKKVSFIQCAWFTNGTCQALPPLAGISDYQIWCR